MTDTPEIPQLTLSTDTADGRARQFAIDKHLARLQVQPTSLIEFRSAGRLLILGPGAAARAAAQRCAAPLQVTLLVPPDDTGAGDEAAVAHAELAGLSGYLGHFEATAQRAGESFNLAEVMTGAAQFDLVLDLNPTPVLAHQMPPLGYYATGGEAAALEAALAQLPTLVGEFEKPKFFNYDPSICAHGRMGKAGCTRCIDACPTLAITSLGERVEVNPNLCQGGGTCVSACPSGAMTYAYPPLTDLLAGLRGTLESYRAKGGAAPRILFYGGEAFTAPVHEAMPRMPEQLFPVELEEIGSLGMEAWLTALAYGADQVLLYAPSALPPLVRQTLIEQVGFARAILQGMGHEGERLRIVEAETAAALLAALQAPPTFAALTPAHYRLAGDKRNTLRDAVDHLNGLAGATASIAALPAGAPFGRIEVDRDACTLCNACVAICPLKALSTGETQPRLLFTEASCVQCGLCESACPESAIRLEPRFLYPREAATTPRLLHEEAPFECVRCGKPFATQKMMAAMQAKLAGHWMFQDETARRRLQMCDECRVIDMFERGDGFQTHHR